MSRFLPYIHNLRGLAILFIVGVHVRGYEWQWNNDPAAYDFFVALFDNGTVLFVFIAGFLFQHLTNHDFHFKEYLIQKTKVVVLPYLLVSIPIIILRIMFGTGELSLPDDFDQHSLGYRIFYFIITGAHMVPFWFMPMIFLIYLSTPLFHQLDKQWFYRFVFPVIFLAGMFTYRPVNNMNPLLAYLHFVPVYLTGMWASFNKERIIALGNRLLIPLVFVYLGISILELTDTITLDKKMNFEAVLNQKVLKFNVYEFKAVILCHILILIFQKFGNRKIVWLETLGKYSFGIYFIHYYFISSVRQIVEMLGLPFKFSTLIFLGFYIGVIALSMATIYLIKSITGKASRYFIGS